MRLRTPQAVVALLFAGTVALGATLVERVDGGFILATKTWHLDPIGEAKLRYTRLTRACEAVEIVPARVARSAIERSDIDEFVRMAAPTPRFASSQAGWLLIEVEPANLEPAIFLLRPVAGRYKQAASYAGTAAPFNNTQVIHEYLQQEAAGAPEQLIKCYEPVGPPFASLQS